MVRLKEPYIKNPQNVGTIYVRNKISIFSSEVRVSKLFQYKEFIRLILLNR